MAHYAYLDENNVVTQVIVGKDEDDGDIDWEEYYGAIRCSYNTRGGIHYGPDGEQSADQSKAYRYNYPGPGWFFDPTFGVDGAFIPPNPFGSWTVNSNTALWEAPVTMPNDGGPWMWDEESLSWVEFPEP